MDKPQRYKVQQDKGIYCLKGCDDGDLVDWGEYEALQRRLADCELSLRVYDQGGVSEYWLRHERTRMETPVVTNGGMKPTCPNCGHEPCAEWCGRDTGAALIGGKAGTSGEHCDEPRDGIDLAAEIRARMEIPAGHFKRGIWDRFICGHCGQTHDKHLHTDEASLCPTANR